MKFGIVIALGLLTGACAWSPGAPNLCQVGTIYGCTNGDKNFEVVAAAPEPAAPAAPAPEPVKEAPAAPEPPKEAPAAPAAPDKPADKPDHGHGHHGDKGDKGGKDRH